MDTKLILDYCRQNKTSKAINALESCKSVCTKFDHVTYDECVELVVSNLKTGEHGTYKLLKDLVHYPATFQYLITVTEKDHKEFGIHDSKSPFEKIMDMESDCRYIPLILANIRYKVTYSLLSYEELEHYVK